MKSISTKLSAAECKTLIKEHKNKYISISNSRISVDENSPNFIDLSGIIEPDIRLTFYNCVFEAPLNLRQSEISTLQLIQCRFEFNTDDNSPIKSGILKPENFCLNLDGGLFRRLDIKLATYVNGQHLPILISAKRTLVEDDVLFELTEANFNSNNRNQAQSGREATEDRRFGTGSTVLNFDDSRIDGRMVVRDTSGSEARHGGLYISLKRVAIGGSLDINGATKDNARTKLALAAEEARIAGEMRLRRLQTYSVQNSNTQFHEGSQDKRVVPAIDLHRADVGVLRVGFPIEANETANNTTVQNDLNEFYSGDINKSAEHPTIADLTVGRIGVFSGEIGQGQYEESYWVEFIDRLMPPLKKSDSDGVDRESIANRRRAYAMFARAADTARKSRVADNLLAEEAKMDTRLSKPDLRNTISISTLGFRILIPIALSLIIIKFYMGELLLIHYFISISITLLFNLTYTTFFGRIFDQNTGWIEYVFRKLFTITVRDGLSPFRALQMLIILWLTATLFSWVAMELGHFAPEEVRIYKSDAELYMLAEEQMSHQEAESFAQKAAEIQMATTVNQFQPTTDLVLGSFGQNTTNGFLQRPDDDDDDNDEHEIDDHYDLLMKTPLLAYHSACRLNWARPESITKNEWAEALEVSLKSVPHLHPALPALQDIDRGLICERLLPAEYSRFEPHIYAADTVIPLLDLRLEKEWSIRVAEPYSGEVNELAVFFKVMEVFFVFVGWFFALVLAGAITTLGEGRRSRL